ncbi:hypothetical protein C8J57DRAFT_1591723 [Mycena rebaudengoi]|nr:hypothetical protein C8J57DRAFT_1591723 [Mycena rebaudengoi]
MSSRASTPPMNDDDDDLRGMLDAMAQSSPIAPDRNNAPKRNHGAMAGDDDGETSDTNQGSGSAPPLALANQNIVAAARSYAQRKRLRGEQLTELDVFLNDLVLLRDAKLLANVFAPAYEVSSDLEINVYKGDSPTDILLAILKKYRFDIPPGLEHNQADWAKVISAVQDALTPKRSKIKKAIQCSLKLHTGDTVYAPDSQHQNIFELTQALRSVYLKHLGPKFWDKLNERLDKIRKEAKSDAKKITKAFRHILTVDQNTHGTTDYMLDEKAVDEFQQTVDNLIDVALVDAATTADGDA